MLNLNIVKTSIPAHIKARRGLSATGRPVVWHEIYNILEKASVGDEFRVNLPNQKQAEHAQTACNSPRMHKNVPDLRFVTTRDQQKDGTFDLYIEVVKR